MRASVIATALALARVGTMSLMMIGLGWFFVGTANLTDRQVVTMGGAAIGLATVADALIRVAVAPPPEFDDEDEVEVE